MKSLSIVKSPMNRSLFSLVGVFLLSSCFIFSGCALFGEKEEAEPKIHSRNDQYRINLSSIVDTAFLSLGSPCLESEEANPIGYRKDGKRLVIDFGISSENVRISNVYDLVEDKGFPKGVWKYHGNKVLEILDSTLVTQSEIDSLLQMDEFFYADEVLYIEGDKIDFSYPRLFIYRITELQYLARNSGNPKFRYFGNDSVQITDDGHEISLRHRPYHSIFARSNQHDDVIDESLDHCGAWDEAIADTWLDEYLFGASELEKASGYQIRGRRNFRQSD